MTGKSLLLAVLVGLATGVIIQFASSGQLFGWWTVLPVPLAILGDVYWERERRRRDRE